MISSLAANLDDAARRGSCGSSLQPMILHVKDYRSLSDPEWPEGYPPIDGEWVTYAKQARRRPLVYRAEPASDGKEQASSRTQKR